MKIDIIIGAQSNFVKIAPIIKAIQKRKKNDDNSSFRLIHTGQHYDKNISDDFINHLLSLN